MLYYLKTLFLRVFLGSHWLSRNIPPEFSTSSHGRISMKFGMYILYGVSIAGFVFLSWNSKKKELYYSKNSTFECVLGVTLALSSHSPRIFHKIPWSQLNDIWYLHSLWVFHCGIIVYILKFEKKLIYFPKALYVGGIFGVSQAPKVSQWNLATAFLTVVELWHYGLYPK